VLKWETSVSLTELPTWLALGGLESVVRLRMEDMVRTTGLNAARVDDCIATSLRKGAGNESMVLVRIVGGGSCYSQHILDMLDVKSSLGLLAFRTGPRKLT
jgi:hypothetical protein